MRVMIIHPLSGKSHHNIDPVATDIHIACRRLYFSRATRKKHSNGGE